jgi:hypothetical protein
MGVKPIETTYRGAHFRSRLEAHWAAFFDLLEWRWEYEPLELDGYIPDFVLLLHKPTLVEVKPAWTCAELERLAAKKIERSGWNGEALIVGASWSTTDSSDWLRDAHVLGVNSEGAAGPWGGHPEREVEHHWNPAVWFGCKFCREMSFLNDLMSYHCRPHGCYDGDGHIGGAGSVGGLAVRWNEAGAKVRWRA